MDLALTDEQDSVRLAFARFFDKQSTIERVRKAEEQGGYDPELWRAAVATGIPTMGVAESAGGGGASFVDLHLVVVESGRRLAAIPLVESVVAARLLSWTSEGAGVVDEIAEGALVTLAPRRAGKGAIAPILGGSVADLVVGCDGEDLVLVRGPEAAPLANLAGLPLAGCALDGSSGQRTVLASGAEAAALFDRAVAEWKTLTAAALVGVQAEAQRLGVDYISGRKVFGTQLASLQAVQHRFADLATAAVGGRLLALEAAWAQDEQPERAPALADMSLLFLAELAQHTCRESLQFHGGYGFTLEYDIQLYLRRAKTLPLLAGPVRHHYQSLAAELFAATDVRG